MLGCLLYELCTLHKPFEGDSLHGVMTKILSQPYMPLPKNYSDTLGGLVKMMLEKNPNVRASVDDLLMVPEVSKMVTEMQKNEIYAGNVIDLTPGGVPRMIEKFDGLEGNSDGEEDIKENEEEKGLDIAQSIAINDISIKPIPPPAVSQRPTPIMGPHAEMQPVTRVDANESIDQQCDLPADEDSRDSKTAAAVSAAGPAKPTKIGPSPGKKPLEIKKSYLTINTCFEPNTPVEKPSAPAKAASTKSHLRSKQKAAPTSKGMMATGAGTTTSQKKSVPKHFIFSESLFSPQAAFSPNRPLLFTEFLIRKLGKEIFDSACNVMKDCVDPLALLDNEPDKLLKVIGKENAQCVQIFKYIISSNVSTPVHSRLSSQQLQLLQQHHSRTRSMQTPDAFMTRIPKLVHLQQNRPFSTRSQVAVAGTKPKSTTSAQGAKKGFMISPLNSAATDASCSPLETPKDL